MKTNLVRASLVAGLVLAVAGLAAAQQPAPAAKGAQDPHADQKIIEALRKDVQAGKADIVAKTMELDATSAAAFWPVYKQYEAEIAKLGDEQTAILKDYAKAWNAKTLTDAVAKDLLTRSIALDDKKVALQKKYLDEMSKVLPAKTVARFYQVQNRLNAFVTLAFSQEIPLVY
jgi:hypothetical protein